MSHCASATRSQVYIVSISRNSEMPLRLDMTGLFLKCQHFVLAERKTASTMHYISCKKGGYPILRHNAIRDTTAVIMKEARCVDVQTEPGLQDCSTNPGMKSHTNIQPGARLDVSARGLFGTFERTFCDVRVTHPNMWSVWSSWKTWGHTTLL